MKFPCRLDKFISHLAEIPRTQARASIKRKEVSVNGEVITSHNFQLAQQDEVLHQGTPLVFLGKRYYMLNKPVG